MWLRIPIVHDHPCSEEISDALGGRDLPRDLSSNMLRKAMCFCYNASLHMMESLSQARLCDPIPTLQRAYWYH